MLRRPAALAPRLAGALALALLLLAGCKPKYDPGEPVELAPEGCCKLANESMTKFAGCRLSHRCKNDEPIWIRGAVRCSAVDQRCAGGRCCELRPVYGTPDAVLNWDGDKEECPGDAEANALLAREYRGPWAYPQW